ncbi:hypothetical protein DFH09DRAFT_1413272 [Mycena vulgaris]|nr:hypothetical protein DFH09DRAFT_1413272 [Mycena vulgaris]
MSQTQTPHKKLTADGVRILTKPPSTVDEIEAYPPPALPVVLGGETVKATISGFSTRTGLADAQSGGGIWFSNGNPANAAIKLPPYVSQSKANAEILAALYCIQSVPQDVNLEIAAKSSTITNAMNRNLGKWEDSGWIGVADRAPIQALAAGLRARTGRTTFRTLNSTSGGGGAENAAALAKSSIQNAATYAPSLEVPTIARTRGAKLATLTQALAYRGIKEQHTIPSRKATEENLKLIQDVSEELFKRTPTPAKIWKSVRHADLSRRVKTFLWKSIHGAHRIGKFWKHIPGYEERGMCTQCNVEETLEHVLLECASPTRAQIWELVRQLWLKKHGQLPPVSMGLILGCCMATFEKESKLKPSGVNRLFRILISESIFLIWKLRCERVIQDKLHSSSEVQNRWIHLLNVRIEVDCFMGTEIAPRGKRTTLPTLVLSTWRHILLEEHKLPDNWLREPRVLVGIVPRSYRSISIPPDPEDVSVY